MPNEKKVFVTLHNFHKPTANTLLYLITIKVRYINPLIITESLILHMINMTFICIYGGFASFFLGNGGVNPP